MSIKSHWLQEKIIKSKDCCDQVFEKIYSDISFFSDLIEKEYNKHFQKIITI